MDPAVGWARPLLPEPGGWGPVHGERLLPTSGAYLGINMVASVDGRVTQAGSAAGLGSATDQWLMRRLRAEADVVLHGAGTLRADRFRPGVPQALQVERLRRGQPRQPIAAMLTSRGDFDPEHPYFRSAGPDWPRLVYTTHGADVAALERPGVQVVRMGDVAVDLAGLLVDLHGRGLGRVVCEGGPSLNRQLIAAGLVDELWVTLAPKLIGGEPALTVLHGVLPAPQQLRLTSAWERAGELYLRYQVARTA